MAFVVPQVGDVAMLNALSVYFTSNGASAVLWRGPSTLTPNHTHVLNNFTAASDITPLTMSTVWAAVVGVGGTAHMTASPFTFTQTANTAQTIYGWYVAVGSDLIFAERFTSAIVLAANGDQVRITGHTFRMNQCDQA